MVLNLKCKPLVVFVFYCFADLNFNSFPKLYEAHRQQKCKQRIFKKNILGCLNNVSEGKKLIPEVRRVGFFLLKLWKTAKILVDIFFLFFFLVEKQKAAKTTLAK